MPVSKRGRPGPRSLWGVGPIVGVLSALVEALYAIGTLELPTWATSVLAFIIVISIAVTVWDFNAEYEWGEG